MITDEKPPLDEDLLMHFGVRGMHWGQRKARPSGGSSGSSAPKQKMATGKKVAIGLGVAAVGASVAAYILSRQGNSRVGAAAKAAVRVESKAASLALRPHTPSPFEMRMAAGQAAHRNTMNRVAAQKLTDKAWRDSAKIKQMSRQMDSTTASLLNNNSAMLKALQDPNHVWRL